MADRTVIVSYEFKADEAELKLVKLRTSLQDLRKEQAMLDKQRKDGFITIEEYNKKSADNAAQQRGLTVEIQSTTKALNADAKARKEATQANEANTGSLNEMRQRLKELKAEYGNLSKVERESAKGQELRDKTKALNDEISKLEQGYGVYSRNVGNYTESVVDALGKSFPLFEQANQYVESLRMVTDLLAQGYQLFSTATDAAAKSTVSMAAAEGVAAKAAEVNATAQAATTAATTGAAGAANVATSSFAKLNLALLANPFGLIVVAVVGLIAYMTQFSGVLDGLEQAWAGVMAATKPVIGAFGAIGKVVFDLFKTVGSAAVTIGKAMLALAKGDFAGAKDAMVQGFDEVKQGIANVSAGIADARKQFAGLGSAMKEAYNAGSDLRRRMQDLEDAEALLALNRIDRENQAKKLELAAANRARAAQARLRDLQEAGRIQQQLANEDAAIARQKYALLREELLQNRDLLKYRGLSNKQLAETMKGLEDAGKLQGDYAADVKRLAELYKNLTDAEEKAANVRLETNAKTGRLVNAIAAQNKKAIEDRIKASQAELEFESRKAKLYAEMAGDEQTRLELNKKAIDAELALNLELAKTEEERLLLKQKANFDKLELDRKYADDREALEREQGERFLELERILNDESLRQLSEANEKRKLGIQQKFADDQISEYEMNQQMLASDLQLYQEQLAALQAAGQNTNDAEKAIIDTRVRMRQNELKQQDANAKAQFEIARRVAGNLSQLATMLAGQNASMAEFQKAVALFNIGISTAESIASVTRIASTTSPDPVTFGISLAGMVATVLSNIAQANAVLSNSGTPQAPSFERGGYIDGRSHASGGVMIEAQGGEFVMNRGAVRMGGSLLSALNAAGNGDMMAMSDLRASSAAMSQRQLLDAIAAMPPQQLNVIDLDRVQVDANSVINNNRLSKL